MTGAALLTLAAPAKINLFLHVIGRRADGYHELQTLFQFLDRCDTVRLRARADGAIRRDGDLATADPGDDLGVRAAALLRRESGARAGADISVRKRIPAGGGLGGGSSDAAAVLVGLDRLWGLGLGVDALAGLGLRLGADVPVFVRGRAAWAEGVGERIEPVEPPCPWYVVAVPRVHVSTPAVFGEPALTRDTPAMRIADLLLDGQTGGGRMLSIQTLMSRTSNDCEAVVRRLHAAVDRAIEWLSGHGPARMTGTGAAVFAPFEEERAARAVLASRPADLDGFVARGLNRSPLADPAR